MKNVLIINGNPKRSSLCRSIAEAYGIGATQAGHQVEVVHIAELDFDPNLQEGYDKIQTLEPDLLQLQEKIQAAHHLVFAFPVWWGSVPALLKGLLDRILLPGFAFKFNDDNPMPVRLLKGKSAQLLITMDTPIWYDRLVNRAPAPKMMVNAVLKFCGIKPIKTTLFAPVKSASEKKRQKWLLQATNMGTKLR